jgi:hypothetical protein
MSENHNIKAVVSARRSAIVGRCFVVFLSLYANVMVVPYNYVTSASFRILFNASFTYQLIIRRYVIWAIKGVVKQIKNKYA